MLFIVLPEGYAGAVRGNQKWIRSYTTPKPKSQSAQWPIGLRFLF
jgi:hypothetical protein